MITVRGQAKLMDFGLAKQERKAKGLTDPRKAASDLTGSRCRIGDCPLHVPSKQEVRSWDARSDIFSLGVTLYESATGQPPFRGESMLEVMHQIAIADHMPASTVNRKLPPEFDAVLLQALAKKRSTASSLLRNWEVR